MSTPLIFPPATSLPDHTQLPEKDGTIVENYQEHPQSVLLSDTLAPRLAEIHGEDNFSIGANSGIYWRFTDPPLRGCKAPDWFFVAGVSPLLDGAFRRSYVLWRESVRPFLVVEYVSGDGSEEHDRTPNSGKFWVYEQGIGAAYYVIFDAFRDALEVYRLEAGAYRRMEPNQHRRYPLPELRIELGMWEGRYAQCHATWLRPWDAQTGEPLPLSAERAEQAEANVDHFQELAAEATEQATAERMRTADAERTAEAQRMRADDAERTAEAQRIRADDAERRSQKAEQAVEAELARVRRLEEMLRAAGIDPTA